MRREPYPEPSSAAVSAVMRANRKTDTKPELLLRSQLHHRGLRFRKNHLIRLEGLSVRPDVVFTKQRVAVFVDGCFWHRCPDHGLRPRSNSRYWEQKLDSNVKRDRAVTADLRGGGWIVVRLWEHMDPSAGADEVLEAVRTRAAAPAEPRPGTPLVARLLT